MTRKILFVPLHTPSMLEMTPIAQQIAEDGQFQPCFFIYRDITEDKITSILQQGFSVIGPHPSDQQSNDEKVIPAHEVENTGISWWRVQIKNFARWLQSMTISSFFLNLITYWVIIRKARRLIEQQSIAAIITIGDRHVGWETALIKVANQKKYPELNCSICPE